MSKYETGCSYTILAAKFEKMSDAQKAVCLKCADYLLESNGNDIVFNQTQDANIEIPFLTSEKSAFNASKPKNLITDEEVELEIERLKNSPQVKLAKKEEAIRNRRRQYMYSLRAYEKKGKQLESEGITFDSLEAMRMEADGGET